MDEKQLLRRAFRWFGVQAPPKLTAKVRKDYGETLKELSAWVRKDKAENPEIWEELDATLGKLFN